MLAASKAHLGKNVTKLKFLVSKMYLHQNTHTSLSPHTYMSNLHIGCIPHTSYVQVDTKEKRKSMFYLEC